MSNKRTGRMPQEHVDLLEERSGGMCESRFTGRGGKHNLANLLALCGSGNHTGCHGVAHQGHAPAGWAISRHERRHEDQVPFVDIGGRTWWLDDEGGKHDRPQHSGRR
jgi:hypothetical protein